jgi:hypothetical protein
VSKERIKITLKGTRIIHLPIDELFYPETIKSIVRFRKWVDSLEEEYKIKSIIRNT